MRARPRPSAPRLAARGAKRCERAVRGATERGARPGRASSPRGRTGPTTAGGQAWRGAAPGESSPIAKEAAGARAWSRGLCTGCNPTPTVQPCRGAEPQAPGSGEKRSWRPQEPRCHGPAPSSIHERLRVWGANDATKADSAAELRARAGEDQARSAAARGARTGREPGAADPDLVAVGGGGPRRRHALPGVSIRREGRGARGGDRFRDEAPRRSGGVLLLPRAPERILSA